MTDQLRECPFCGGDAMMQEKGTDRTPRRFIEIWCVKCRATMENGAIRWTLEKLKAETIAAWNTRPAAPVEANREALLVDALNELRNCSRAKIGMEDDFACADKQMRDALAPNSPEIPDSSR